MLGVPADLTPAEAWRVLADGNARFVAGTVEHPSQGADRRAEVRDEQRPYAVLVGCSDSRVAAEIIFDRGLGDLFVVRTAGHVPDVTVLGSIEYGVALLGVPLVVVLGHRGCGAVAATRDHVRTGREPVGYVRGIVDRIRPHVADLGEAPDDDAVRRHVRATVRELVEDSVVVARAVAAGTCAVVGATYELVEGRVVPEVARGPVDLGPGDGSMGA